MRLYSRGVVESFLQTYSGIDNLIVETTAVLLRMRGVTGELDKWEIAWTAPADLETARIHVRCLRRDSYDPDEEFFMNFPVSYLWQEDWKERELIEERKRREARARKQAEFEEKKRQEALEKVVRLEQEERALYERLKAKYADADAEVKKEK